MQQPTNPFQGPADLVLSTTRPMMRVGLIGTCAVGGAMLLLLALAPFLPESSTALRSALGGIFELFALAFAGWYLHLLAKAMRTQTRRVTVYADARGLALDGVLVATREDLRVATIRMPRAATDHATRHGVLSVDSTPLTVEIATDDEAWNLAVGDIDRGAALLVAMGVPPTSISADHPRHPTRADRNAQRPFKIAVAVLVGAGVLVSVGSAVLASLRR